MCVRTSSSDMKGSRKKKKRTVPLYKPAVDVGRHMAVVVTTISLALFKSLYLVETTRSSIKCLTLKFLFPEN